MTDVLTVTLNPAVDRTLLVDDVLEGVVRARKAMAMAGGKGINVARVARSLGARVSTTGLAAGHAGRWLVEQLVAEGLQPDFVSVAGETRTSVTVYGGGRPGVNLIEPGPRMGAEDLRRLVDHLSDLATRADAIVASGSLPTGLPTEAYAEVVKAGRGDGRCVLLDARGPALAAGLEAGPTIVKVTEDEARTVLGDGGGAEQLVAELCRGGCELAIVTLGERGAVGSDGRRCLRARGPVVDDPRPIGSGDAFAAATALEWVQGGGLPAALRAGVAAGTANAGTDTAGNVDARRVAQLLPQIVVEPC